MIGWSLALLVLSGGAGLAWWIRRERQQQPKIENVSGQWLRDNVYDKRGY